MAASAGALLTAASMVTMTAGASAAAPAAGSVADHSTRFTALAQASAFHTLKNVAFGQCIDAPGGQLNVRLQLADCSNSPTQKWAFIPVPGAAKTYSLVNQASGYCAEVNNGTSTPGEAVDQYTCNTSGSEYWIKNNVDVGELTYQKFEHAGTGLCLDTVGAAGSQLMQWGCSDAHPPAAQMWILSP
ncbi:RICIN domain-containing protein [Streptomyces sp. SID12488]|uniref:RICIN domain-containing protein n=1 Tax=Streptomyces sp. SID12488 TaxID=2706040 RepID=UPI0013DC9B92|nr:RICIN domain-containing protein [Streptomyces sp. SID12488]NEA68773.1 ricin-type beta-trefoil lectin domain protein [Streptomyces sp. SID12488]